VTTLASAQPVPALAFRSDAGYRRGQRAFDVCVAFAALAASGPVLLLAMLAIALEDGFPVFFRQRRVGHLGRLFTIYKLRTMRRDRCGDQLSPQAAGDARVTRVGRWLRRTSIDELPQFLNVLRGDMAVVGPRPEMPFVVATRYERWQHLRHLAKPGITGLWQTTCRSSVPLHEPAATRIDLDYVRRASLYTDGKIVLQTFQMLVSGRGAY
jgi:lipopolysaccharide/colanic/teichoic acid biosynthesis glycosyltransferase